MVSLPRQQDTGFIVICSWGVQHPKNLHVQAAFNNIALGSIQTKSRRCNQSLWEGCSLDPTVELSQVTAGVEQKVHRTQKNYVQ